MGWVKQVHAVREGGRWYAVLVYENGGQLPDASGAGEVVGVDVGIKVLAFTSDGEEYDNPAVVQAWRAEAAAHQQGHRTKHQPQPQQTHQSTWAALRATGTVAIPTGESTADAPAADCIRDSEVRRYGGSGNAERGRDGTQPTLAKALSDAAVGGFLQELEWQCVKRGVLLLKAGMWFPSTQICARCGGRPNARIDLSVWLYRCHL